MKTGTEVWIPPGGGLEPEDTSVVERLRREFLEETGLSIEVGALLYVRECPKAETGRHGIELYFAVHSPRGEVNHIEGQHAPFGADKRRHVRWFTRAEAIVACVRPIETLECLAEPAELLRPRYLGVACPDPFRA